MGYIFEAEIESIINIVRVKTIGEDDGILLKKILTANIHPAIKAYFRAEVEKTLLQERTSEYRSKKFSYSLPEVVSLQQRIDILLIQNYHFSRQEYESLLDESVHFQFNYLCRPQWTLLNFIVGEQRKVASATIETRLHYCVDYKYFPEIIKRYIVEHGLAEVTYEEFKTLLEKIDREVIAQHSSLELAYMTRALFDFVESGKMEPIINVAQQTLPINAAIVFFDDKHLNNVCIRLEFERDRNKVSQITVARLADIIEIVRTGNEDATAHPVPMPAVLTPVENPSGTDVREQESMAGIDNNSEEPEALIVQQMGENTALSEGHVLSSIENGNQSLTSVENPRITGILGLFSDEERNVFVEKIFANKDDEFQESIKKISLLQTWEEVAHYLDALFLANDIDPFSAEAVSLTDKLFMNFQSSDTVQ